MTASETERLEDLWAGEFGDAYVDRNLQAGEGRGPFWRGLLPKYPVERVLEVGCNIGTNLQWISQMVAPKDVYGIDVNAQALRLLRTNLPDVNALWAQARELPFRDGWFDLVFTAGVLIHVPDVALFRVMTEIVRCSRRYVLCMEYFAEATTEVPYRGQRDTLFKRNYGAIYQDLFPELGPLEQGFLPRGQGWDDVTYWLLEKR